MLAPHPDGACVAQSCSLQYPRITTAPVMLRNSSRPPYREVVKRGWGRDSSTMARNGAAEIGEGAASLHTAGLRKRKQARCGNLSQSTAIAKAGLTPLHGNAQGALGAVVGRLHSRILEKYEQAVAMLKQGGSQVAHRAILAIQMPLSQREPVLLQPKRTLL